MVENKGDFADLIYWRFAAGSQPLKADVPARSYVMRTKEPRIDDYLVTSTGERVRDSLAFIEPCLRVERHTWAGRIIFYKVL